MSKTRDDTRCKDCGTECTLGTRLCDDCQRKRQKVALQLVADGYASVGGWAKPITDLLTLAGVKYQYQNECYWLVEPWAKTGEALFFESAFFGSKTQTTLRDLLYLRRIAKDREAFDAKITATLAMSHGEPAALLALVTEVPR